MNEKAAKAAQTADLLVQDLRELHKALCADAPPPETRMAEQYALRLLQEAVRLREQLKGIAP